MPLQQTSGAASYDAFGGGAPVAAKYIEDFFSAWLRTGTGSSQTVTTGIKENTGALVISKSRSAATDWAWYDTFRGATKDLVSNSTAAETTQSQGLTSFNADGHTWGTLAKVNTSGATYVDYVLKPQPKFFDVVTYTGNNAARTIAHSLGSAPGCIIIKPIDSAVQNNWVVYHQSLGNTSCAFLNLTDAAASGVGSYWNSTTPTSTVFSLGTANATNQTGINYVAYLFAHNAGGFGLTGTDNVISCGSFTTDGSGNATVNIGYEPQWVLYKPSTAINNWKIFDNMRGMVVGNGDKALYLNTSGAEVQDDSIQPAATGFSIVGGDASATHIYIAIRRGPMKTPTTGTSVFAPTVSSAATGTALTTNFPIDLQMAAIRDGNSTNTAFSTRLIGVNSTPATVNNNYLVSSSAGAELTASFTRAWNNTGFQMPSYLGGSNDVFWSFQRAPGFFDVVCYTGTGNTTTQNVTHNLGVKPQLMLVKSRGSIVDWQVYSEPTTATNLLVLNSTAAAAASSSRWNNTEPTSSVFTVGPSSGVNASGVNYVAYLFASCPGVSKVGSYTGNGSTQTINCGFTGGARFVLIKRTDSTGDWYVYDTARGMTTLTDPYLLLNSTAAESATLGSVTTVTTGFALNAGILAAINTNAASYIFLAIA